MNTSHVVSQGLAEELKASGWPQEGSTFYWLRQGGSEWIIVQHMLLETYLDDTGHLRFSTRGNTEVIACPLASELMEWMPNPLVEMNGQRTFITVQRVGGYYECGYEGSWISTEEDKTLPDALAKLALHLMKENKLNLE